GRGSVVPLLSGTGPTLLFRIPPVSFRGPGPRPGGSPVLWLYLHFPPLLLDHVRRNQDATSALAIVDGAAQGVVQACPTARDLSVTSGMILKTALGLAPDVNIMRGDAKQRACLLEDQARWLYHYAAHITQTAPEGLWAEVSSL